MGQRLVINIKKENKIIASAYYHWSAYTNAAIDTVMPLIKLLNAFDDEPPARLKFQEGPEEGPKLDEMTNIEAVWVLRITRADITNHELEMFEEKFPEKKSKISKMYRGDNRNDGLVAISEEGIEDNNYWGEHFIELNIDKRTVDFGVLYKVEKDELKAFQEERELVDLKGHYDLKKIPFKGFEKFANLIREKESAPSKLIRIANNEYYSTIG